MLPTLHSTPRMQLHPSWPGASGAEVSSSPAPAGKGPGAFGGPPRPPGNLLSSQGGLEMQNLFIGVFHWVESKGLQVGPRAHPLRPEAPSLPARSPAAAGGFTVNKTTAENDLSSGRKEKVGGGKKNNPFFDVLISTSFSGFLSGALMERRPSAGSCRPGKEQCRRAAGRRGEGKGRAGANWKRERRSPGLAAAFPGTGRVVPEPSGEQGGALAHGGVPGPHLPQQVPLQNPAFLLGQGPGLGEDAPEKDQTKHAQDTGWETRCTCLTLLYPKPPTLPVSRSSGRAGALGRRLWAGTQLLGTTPQSGCPFPTSHS